MSAAAAAALGFAASAPAANLYWDDNGTAAGGGGTTAPGTWGLSNFWNTDSAGGAGTFSTTVGSGNVAVFSAGTDVTSTSSVTLSTTQAADGVTFEEGVVTLTAGTLSLTGASTITVGAGTANRTGRINSAITATNEVIVTRGTTGGATLQLGAANTFSGGLKIDGAVRVNQNVDGALGSNLITITGNGATISNENATTTTSSAISQNISLNPNSVSAFLVGLGGGREVTTLTFAGNITGASDVAISADGNSTASNGNGVTVFSGTNNQYTGATILNNGPQGVFRLGSAGALPTGTAVIFGRNSGQNIGAMDLNGENISIASLETFLGGSATAVGLTNSNGAAGGGITITGSAVKTFSSVIGAVTNNNVTGTQNLSLTLAGSHTGNLSLSGANNYTGPTTIDGGTLTVAHTATTANTLAGDVVVNSTGTLASAGGSGFGQPSPTIAGIGGSVTVNSGAAIAPGGGGVGVLSITNGLTLNDQADLNFNLFSLINYDSINLGGSALTLDSGLHEINLLDPTVAAGTYTLATYGSVTPGSGFTMGTAPSGFTYATTLGANALTLQITPLTQTLVWDIGGGGSPIVEGAGTWSDGSTDFTDLSTNSGTTFSNTNNFDVTFGNDVAAAGGTITLGTNIRAGGQLIFGPISAAAPYVIGDGTTTNTLTLAGGITANSHAGINAPVVLDVSQTWKAANSVTLAVAGSISDGIGGPASITKTGGGVLALTGANTFSGGLIINEGTVDANSDATLGAGAVTIDNGATFRFGGSYSTDNYFTVNALGGKINSVVGFDSTITGVISGAGVLTKNGDGLLTLSNNNTFGSLTVDNGAVAFANEISLGAGAVTMSGGALRILNDVTLTKNLILASGTNNRIDTLGFTLTHAGTITGAGDLYKNGAGRLIITNDNSARTGLTVFSNSLYDGNPNTDGGTIETGHVNALGGGNVQVFAPATLQTNTSLSVGAVRGDNVLTKTGPGTLTVTGSTTAANSGGSLVVNAGAVQMNSRDSLGGLNPTTNVAQAQMDVTLNAGTELLLNWGSGTARRGGGFVLNDATMRRLSTAPLNTESEFVTYNSTANFGESLVINGNSKLHNQSVSNGTDNSGSLVFIMPVTLNAGATLTMQSDNNTGDYDSFFVGFRATTIAGFVGTDPLTMNEGSTLIMAGPGDKRIGGVSNGKNIIVNGNATMKLDSRTFMTDVGTQFSKIVVNATGDNGLRIEAPMNASYTTPIDPQPVFQPEEGFTGLFGTNTQSTMEGGTPPANYSVIGNAYTVFTTKRANALSDGTGGTLTLAATDAGGATGVIASGPNAATPIKLALDNTPTSGNLVYEIQPSADSGKFANFGGLVIQRSNPSAGAVTARVNADGTAAGVLRVNTLSIAADAGLDLTDNDFIVQSGAFTDVQNMVLGGFGNTTLIHSSTSDGTQIHALFDNAQVGATDWLGHTLTPTAIVGKYTYFGDVNLDGQVTGDDYAVVDSNLDTDPPVGLEWLSGDANLDGIVTGDDYATIDSNLGLGVGNPLQPSTLAVPEPATGLLAAAAGFLLGRRRRSRTSTSA